MAEQNGVQAPTSENTAPVIQQAPGSMSQPAPEQQQPGQAGGNIDPTKRPPELQQIYRSLQSDYTKKTQDLSEKEKSWAGEREKYQKIEQQFQDLDKRVKRYAEQERNWQQWTPFLQQVSKEGVMEKVQAILNGQNPAASQ